MRQQNAKDVASDIPCLLCDTEKEDQNGDDNAVPPRDHSARLFVSVHHRMLAAGGRTPALADAWPGRWVVDSSLVKGVNGGKRDDH